MTTWLILNGKSAGDEDLRAAIKKARQGDEIDVRATWEGGDAARLVHEAVIGGASRIIAAGGDGTLNEVANALAVVEGERPTLGLVPMGTANDFAHGAGLPLQPAKALKFAFASDAVDIDLLKVTSGDDVRWCINVVTGGFGTQVTTETDPKLKERLGGLAYVITGISKMGKATPQNARFVMDDFDQSGEFIAIGIGNGRQAGGGQVLCPDALVNDGELDLTIVPAARDSAEFFEGLSKALGPGSASALEKISFRRRRPWVEVSSETEFTLNLDGEPMHGTRFRLEVAPAHLRMHLPPKSPLLSR